MSKERIKQLVNKTVLTDEEIKEFTELLRKEYPSKYWAVADEVLAPYLELSAQEEDDLDEYLKDMGAEGETFKAPQYANMKLLKTQNSKLCMEEIEPALIGQFAIEERGLDENGEITCKPKVLGKEVKCLPVMKIPYIGVRIEKGETAKVYRVFPKAEELEQPFKFIEKVSSKVSRLLEKNAHLIDNFKVRKSAFLFLLTKAEGDKLPKLYRLDLSPVDSVRISEFERKLRQMTGVRGFAAVFKTGKRPYLKSVRVDINGNRVIAAALDLSQEQLRDPRDWKVILLPIIAALKNWTEKMPHEFTLPMLEADLGEEGSGESVVETPSNTGTPETSAAPAPAAAAPAASIEEPPADDDLSGSIDEEDFSDIDF